MESDTFIGRPINWFGQFIDLSERTFYKLSAELGSDSCQWLCSLQAGDYVAILHRGDAEWVINIWARNWQTGNFCTLMLDMQQPYMMRKTLIDVTFLNVV